MITRFPTTKIPTITYHLSSLEFEVIILEWQCRVREAALLRSTIRSVRAHMDEVINPTIPAWPCLLKGQPAYEWLDFHPILIHKDRWFPSSVHILIGHHRVRNWIFYKTQFSPRSLPGEIFVYTHTLCMGSSAKHLPLFYCFIVEDFFLVWLHLLINSHFLTDF